MYKSVKRPRLIYTTIIIVHWPPWNADDDFFIAEKKIKQITQSKTNEYHPVNTRVAIVFNQDRFLKVAKKQHRNSRTFHQYWSISLSSRFLPSLNRFIFNAAVILFFHHSHISQPTSEGIGLCSGLAKWAGRTHIVPLLFLLDPASRPPF